MTDVTREISISADINQVWAALTDAKVIAAWMDDDSAAVDLRIGGIYALFGGDTTGAFTRIEPPRLLEYTWRQSSWSPDWKDSVVHWELSSANGETSLRLVHSAFPNDAEQHGHDEGWDIYWLEPMLAYLEGAQ